MALKRTVEYLVLPGYGGSGPLHWQTLWEADPAFLRVEQRDWEHPDRADWVRKLEMAVSRPGPAARCAADWGSRLVEVGPQGHINGASGLGAWEEGRRLLATLPA